MRIEHAESVLTRIEGEEGLRREGKPTHCSCAAAAEQAFEAGTVALASFEDSSRKDLRRERKEKRQSVALLRLHGQEREDRSSDACRRGDA